MATDKKHIAVYLDPAVEQALIAFCQEKSLISKKGTMFSAGVNAALTQFFGIADTKASNIPEEIDNTPFEIDNIPQNAGNILISASNIPASASNIPNKATGNIPTHLNNIPVKSLVMGELPGKSQT
jgi:hypothetical protein